MPGELITTPPARYPRPAAAGDEVSRLAAAAAAYADGSKAPSTRRAYETKWRQFECWCTTHRTLALPASPDVIALYLAEIAPSKSVSTLNGVLAAIGEKHRSKGFATPSSGRLTEVWAGIRRANRRDPRQAAALVTADLRKVVARLPETLAGTRDRAVLLLGFAGAFRRSELAALELAANSCSFVPGGLQVRLARSKTDQEGYGQVVAIPRGKTKLCPVSALRAWLNVSGVAGGAIFREVDRHGRVGDQALKPEAVGEIVKRAVLRAGFDPSQFSGHSLRAGFVTSAAQAGVTTELIMRQTRHKKAETVAIYVRDADLFTRNAASRIGL